MVDVLQTDMKLGLGIGGGPTRAAMEEKPSKEAWRLVYATKLDVGYFARSRVEEFLKFGSRIVATRTTLGTRQIVTMPGDFPYQSYVYRRVDGLCCVVIADEEYPKLSAFQICNKVLAEFDRVGNAAWKAVDKDHDGGKPCDWLMAILELSQDPKEVDKLAAIQRKLDDITVIMQQNIEKCLERGENLNSLMDKAEDLSASSKLFLKDTEKLNSCCHRYFGR